MLLGLLQAQQRAASVLGYDPARQTKAMQARVGYMSQLFTLYNDLTAARTSASTAGPTACGGRAAPAPGGDPGDGRPAGPRNTLTRNLSGGWKQRLALGCAIVHRPQVVFLDEPTAGVDPISRREFWGLIYAMAKQGVTVMVTTHYMDEAELCQRVGFISQGALVALDTPARSSRRRCTARCWRSARRPRPGHAGVEGCPGRRALPLDEVALYGAQIHAVVPVAEEYKERIVPAREGIAVHSIEWIAPTLEDVFISAIKPRG